MDNSSRVQAVNCDDSTVSLRPPESSLDRRSDKKGCRGSRVVDSSQLWTAKAVLAPLNHFCRTPSVGQGVGKVVLCC